MLADAGLSPASFHLLELSHGLGWICGDEEHLLVHVEGSVPTDPYRTRREVLDLSAVLAADSTVFDLQDSLLVLRSLAARGHVQMLEELCHFTWLDVACGHRLVLERL